MSMHAPAYLQNTHALATISILRQSVRMIDPVLSHLDPQTAHPRMVDVGEKATTSRVAVARASVHFGSDFAALVGPNMATKKGAVLHTAIIAGTMAVKRTHELIPFCHPLAIEACNFGTRFEGFVLHIDCEVKIIGKTGVEMEALVGANIAALTVLDMCKSISHDMRIASVQLIRKSGGKSDIAIA